MDLDLLSTPRGRHPCSSGRVYLRDDTSELSGLIDEGRSSRNKNVFETDYGSGHGIISLSTYPRPLSSKGRKRRDSHHTTLPQKSVVGRVFSREILVWFSLF